MKRLAQRYAGPSSVEFWKRISDLKGKHRRGVAYSLGVALQNLEHQVLATLERLENESEAKRQEKS